MTTRVCRTCEEEKNYRQDFYPGAARCKKCSNKARWENGRFKDEEDKQKILAQNRAAYAAKNDKYTAKQRDRYYAKLEYNQKYNRDRRRTFAQRAKDLKGGKCIRCGFDHPAALDFHHRDPLEKRFNVSSALVSSYSWEEILAEVEKCDLICSNCHRIEHWRDDG